MSADDLNCERRDRRFLRPWVPYCKGELWSWHAHAPIYQTYDPPTEFAVSVRWVRGEWVGSVYKEMSLKAVPVVDDIRLHTNCQFLREENRSLERKKGSRRSLCCPLLG